MLTALLTLALLQVAPPPAASLVVAPPAPAPVAGSSGLHALLARSRYDATLKRFIYVDPAGPRTPLTFDPALQLPMQRLINSYQAPLAQFVAIDPVTGRVLAAIESQSTDPIAAHLAEGGTFPAASVFKIVTASALLARGVAPDEEICFHGGKHRIHSRELDDDERRDSRCDTLAEALAHSANVAIAKLADRDLDPIFLRDWASRLLFNQPLPSDWPMPPSGAVIPDDSFDFASTAAGFGAVTLGAFHGAALAGAIANGGQMVPIQVFERAPSANPAVAPAQAVQIVPATMAADLSAMMQLTVSEGTARRAFHFKGAKLLEAAGKTGSIADKQHRDYSWFVGFAPASDPKIAVAALIVNGPHWRIHAAAIAAAALRTYLHDVTPRQLTAGR